LRKENRNEVFEIAMEDKQVRKGKKSKQEIPSLFAQQEQRTREMD
jgi:hypothetical protein